MDSIRQDDLFPHVHNPPTLQFINERCQIRTQDAHRLVLVSGMAWAQYALGDRMSEAHAMVSLIDQGWADQNDVARAFGYSVRTARRYQRRFEEGGLAALAQPEGYPRGRVRLPASRRRLVQQLKTQGHSHYEIARRLGVSVRAVRKTLRRLGWKPPALAQPELPLAVPSPRQPAALSAQASVSLPAPSLSGGDPNLSAFSSDQSLPTTSDTDPMDRSGDRLLARLGLLDDAAPLFGSHKVVQRAGVLLAVPALIASGIFDRAQKIYHSLGPAFFGLRTTLLTLLLTALWRIRRPEGLKEYCPEDLGRVLGVNRAPEVKTLRRKLKRLASFGRAAELGKALAQERIAQRGQAVGFLYVDGHVRVYHGKHRLPKAHVARMRLSMPATSDYWVNDTAGEPLFVITAQANAGLVKMLPGILEEMRALLGSRRATVVFDRGGFSPALFQKILEAGFDLLTYRKGRVRRIPARCFREHRTRVDGRTFTYRLADQQVRLLKGKLRLRQVTRQKDDGHQTPILTSRRDLSPAQIAYRMFNRWRQENFFKVRREVAHVTV